MSWFDNILYPIMWVVAWIMYAFHKVFEFLGLDPAGGAAWGLSIVGLVIVMRIILIPLFFKQIKAQRGLQLIQPEMQKIQKKYKGKTDPASREAMSRETMALYQKHGTNPFSSCLPILAQSPIFFALFRVLNSLPQIANGTWWGRESVGPITQGVASQAESASIFGAPLSGTFMNAAAFGDGSQALHIRIVTIVLIVAMSVTTFTTQRQLTMKNMPPAALEGPMAQQQKMMMYIFPLIFAFSGVNFPIGVLIYWTTTNLWTMGQQFYTIRRIPAPGSQAEIALKARRAKKAAARGEVLTDDAVPGIEEARPAGGQRQQPVGKARAKKKAAPVMPELPPVTPSASAPSEPTASEKSGSAPKAGSSKSGAAKSGTAGKSAPTTKDAVSDVDPDEFDPNAGGSTGSTGKSASSAKKRKRS